MIRIRTRRRERRALGDSGALSDLAFLLIIFFIVIAVFNVNSGFLLGLPRRDSVTTVNVDDLLRVEVNAEGAFLVAGERLDRAELAAAVEERRELQPNMTLLAKIDPEAPYQALVTLVEIARTADVDNFSFSEADGEGTTSEEESR